MKFIFSFDKNKFLRPVEITHISHDIVWFSIFYDKNHHKYYDPYYWTPKKKSNLSSIKIKLIFIFGKNKFNRPSCWNYTYTYPGRHSMVFLFCQDTGVFFSETDVGFGGWENIWEIMYHSANVTKYVGLEPLRPSSIIITGIYSKLNGNGFHFHWKDLVVRRWGEETI